MAAKVAMVAVPAVLGIASIRVYTISETPTEGLVTREKLNIYTPVTKSAQVQRVPDQPGQIESGLATAREGLLPFVHAVKGACVSVKTGSVNLYHAGEDVYYYLKDPPPGFLPRLGTITMAGLLGMFLARKGSRLKRIAIPLGLVSAGASVCYPAQAVAVLKVTGKKMYAAGQWSRAAVSSLLTSKPPEPDAAPQPQATPVPPPEAAVVDEPRHASEPGSAQCVAIPDAEAGSVECVPAADKLIIAIAAEETSVTLAETSAEQAPAEIDSEVISPAFDGTPVEILPDEPTLSSEAESAQVESAPAEVLASSEDLPTRKASHEQTVPDAESTKMTPAGSVEEGSPARTPAEQPAANSKEGAGFTADPALLDFGQSSPEDEDLYSTR
ncbi:MICOS complex subunit MIC27 isoform X3 [Festucalex cinctus]